LGSQPSMFYNLENLNANFFLEELDKEYLEMGLSEEMNRYQMSYN